MKQALIFEPAVELAFEVALATLRCVLAVAAVAATEMVPHRTAAAATERPTCRLMRPSPCGRDVAETDLSMWMRPLSCAARRYCLSVMRDGPVDVLGGDVTRTVMEIQRLLRAGR